MKQKILKAIADKHQSKINEAKSIIDFATERASGVGGHNRELVEEVEKELKTIGESEDVLETIQKHFGQDKGVLSE
tara:strand:- start:361 stop:588 length:228 start_codon:yes stop_codon:yes gene_type:complete